MVEAVLPSCGSGGTGAGLSIIEGCHAGQRKLSGALGLVPMHLTGCISHPWEIYARFGYGLFCSLRPEDCPEDLGV